MKAYATYGQCRPCNLLDGIRNVEALRGADLFHHCHEGSDVLIHVGRVDDEPAGHLNAHAVPVFFKSNQTGKKANQWAIASLIKSSLYSEHHGSNRPAESHKGLSVGSCADPRPGRSPGSNCRRTEGPSCKVRVGSKPDDCFNCKLG